jgi:hypothetical protein
MPGVDGARAGEMKSGRDDGAGVSRPVEGDGGDTPGCEEASDVAAVKADGDAKEADGSACGSVPVRSSGCEKSDDDDESGSPSPPGPTRFSLPDSPPVECPRLPDGFLSGLTLMPPLGLVFLGLTRC